MKTKASRQQEARTLLELGCEKSEEGRTRAAAALFEKAAALGSNEAKVNLANILSESDKVKPDVARAKELYRSAYRGGCAQGATALGVQYKKEAKHRFAVLWFQKAAGMGDEMAVEYLSDYEKITGKRGQ